MAPSLSSAAAPRRALLLLCLFTLPHTVAALTHLHDLPGPRSALLLATAATAALTLLAYAAARAAHRGLPLQPRRGLMPAPATLRRAAVIAVVTLVGASTGALRTGPEPWPLDAPIRLHGTVVEVTPGEGFALLDATLLPSPDTPPALAATLPRSLDTGRPLHVGARPFDPPEPGASIEVDATLRLPRVPNNPSTTPRTPPAPYAEALSDPRPSTRPASWSARATLDLRARLTFDSPTATALYRALLLGDRSELSPEARFAYQDTGTAHLLAISGMNLAVLGLGLFLGLRALLILLPLSRRYAQGRRLSPLAAAGALTAVALYGLIIAPSDATDRALVALALGLSAAMLLRRLDPLRALTLALCGAALVDPGAPLRAGFQLSFAATAAIILSLPHAARWKAYVLASPRLAALPGPLRWLLVTAGGLAIADLATSLATLPLSLAWFGQLPLHGLWVNLLAIPFMSLLVFPLGVAWLVLATLWPGLGELTAPALVALGEAFDAFITSAGAAVGTTTTNAWPLALGVLATLAMLGLLVRRPRLAPTLSALGLAALAALFLVTSRAAPGLHLLALDVGHGDALALRLPDGARVLVDAGGHLRPEQNRRLAERVVVPALLAAGFSRLDLMVLTHADLDHAGAAALVASRIPVAELWVPPCSRGAPPIEAAIAVVSASGGRVRTVARAPAFTWSGAELELLGPPPGLLADGPDGPRCAAKDNDASLVLRVAYAGRRLLLTGDIEHPAEDELLAWAATWDQPALRAPDLHADLLKVPHHGSKSSSTERFLDAVRPSYALVSGLPGKAPMPPHDAVLARYAERGISTLITGRDGAIAAHIPPDGGLSVHALEPAGGSASATPLRPP